MKKLSKILATISTVTLLSCVWGVDTHAEVKKNGLGVPTHIEADDESEFLDNLKEVLEYINSRLESKDKHGIDSADQNYTNWKPEEDNITDPKSEPYNPEEKKEYRFVLQAKQMTNPCAIGYLYQLLCKSKIADQTLPGVWRMYVKYRFAILYDNASRFDDIIFRLPYDTSTYCVCNQRWRMISLLDDNYEVKPTEVTESFKEEVKYNYISTVELGIVTQPEKLPPNTNVYKPQDLQSMTDADITKLIEVSRLDKIDQKLLQRYFDRSNSITDFAKFKKRDAISQKLAPKPLAKK